MMLNDGECWLKMFNYGEWITVGIGRPLLCTVDIRNPAPLGMVKT